MSRHRCRIPELAEHFVDSLRQTLKPSTCLNYRYSLFCFHDWLDHHGHSLETLKREQMSRWLEHLVERGQGPATRVQVIVKVRVYLRALNEAELLRTPADQLLRPSDLPKVPQYLPRPLAPTVDQQLQQRLAASQHPYHRGLLVMRNTGLRIGELSALSLDCLREDGLGSTFLKVPLGKLNSERLVPLDRRTRALIEGLQRTGRPGRDLLLETPRGKPTHKWCMQAALNEVTAGLDSTRVTTHRLRHTYATTLLNAGMSLVGVMKLLGHRDYKMTLRYAAITLETVGREYRGAVAQLEKRYLVPETTSAPELLEPADALSDVILWVQKRSTSTADRVRARLLVKRLRRLRDELRDL